MIVVVTLAGTCGGACAQETSIEPEPDAEQLQALATTEAMAMAERIGEADQPSAAGDACVAACASSYALICHRIRVLCAAAEVVTIGGATVECATALGVACVGGVALGAICARRCPP
jgi:hypothetical protein